MTKFILNGTEKGQKGILKSFNHIFVQNDTSLKILADNNIKKVSIGGDLRFETVIQNKELHEKDELINKFCDNKKAFILGSSWRIDEMLLFDIINDEDYESKVIIAPHDINNDHIRFIEKNLKKKAIRYSQKKEIQMLKF